MNIHHDLRKRQFYVEIESYQAVLMYAQKDKTLDFYHIYVPDPFRNRGVAAKILMAAFEYAEKEGLRVVPSCPFIAGDFLPRFPQYQKLIQPGEFPFTHR